MKKDKYKKELLDNITPIDVFDKIKEHAYKANFTKQEASIKTRSGLTFRFFYRITFACLVIIVGVVFSLNKVGKDEPFVDNSKGVINESQISGNDATRPGQTILYNEFKDLIIQEYLNKDDNLPSSSEEAKAPSDSHYNDMDSNLEVIYNSINEGYTAEWVCTNTNITFSSETVKDIYKIYNEYLEKQNPQK